MIQQRLSSTSPGWAESSCSLRENSSTGFMLVWSELCRSGSNFMWALSLSLENWAKLLTIILWCLETERLQEPSHLSHHIKGRSRAFSSSLHGISGPVLSPLPHQSPKSRWEGLLSLVLKRSSPFDQRLEWSSLRPGQNPPMFWDTRALTLPSSFFPQFREC